MLRSHINKTLDKPCPTMEELTTFYQPKLITKDVWGSYIWKLIHNVTLRVKLIDGFCESRTCIAMKSFITCIAVLLPCPQCRQHAWEYYSKHPINSYLDTNLHAFEWTVFFHNAVSNRVNPVKRIYLPLEALQLYVKQLPSEDLISELKIWGTQVKPPIFDWPDEKSNAKSGKATRTKSDNLQQYINCLPSENACLDIIKTIPWTSSVSFPLTKDMKANPIQESSTITRERSKHITDVKHITEEERLAKIGGVKRKTSSSSSTTITLRGSNEKVQDSPNKKQKLTNDIE
jgi:hypothetical protein